MEVIAFVGPSGTGKSYRALKVALDNDVQCIIDDGILIYNNRLVAGSSAKKESSRLKAVRRAIFQDKKQIESVRNKLEAIQPKRLMILGTSENMVKKITKALGLSDPARYIHIEDVATTKEIERAQYARLKEGKHIIPVPTMELKPHFKGYIIDPLKSIFRRRGSQTHIAQIGDADFENSVVRPAFSFYGRLTFSDAVILSLIRNGLEKVPGVASGADIHFRKSKSGPNSLQIQVEVNLYKGYNPREIMPKAQKAIKFEVEYMTGMTVERMTLEPNMTGLQDPKGNRRMVRRILQ